MIDSVTKAGTANEGIRRLRVALPLCLLSLILLSACVQNPVTGNKDFLLVSEDWEMQIGTQQYLPLRQSQGGDYVVDPGVENYVQGVGRRLAAQSDRKLPYEFHVINDSTPNAWALPGGKISINRGLLVRLKDEAELAAVLGHEIVHAAAKHGARGQTRGIGLQLGVMTASILGAREGYGQQAQLLSSVGAQIINSRYGQDAELEADRFGMDYMARAGYDPQGAVQLQRTFVALSGDRRDDALSRLFASHPPSVRRVNENIETAARLPDGGKVGQAEYRTAMARLFKTRKAYEAYDKAQLAMQKNDPRQASTLLREAMRIEPNEAH
ncbi:MAG: M48 family metallopeptidase, partial [Granulosicoccus sp.]|nr:M48 family metallopeptidase [Granulosicoccus sp.]